MARSTEYDSRYYESIGDVGDERELSAHHEESDSPDIGALVDEKVIFFNMAEQTAWSMPF